MGTRWAMSWITWASRLLPTCGRSARRHWCTSLGSALAPSCSLLAEARLDPVTVTVIVTVTAIADGPPNHTMQTPLPPFPRPPPPPSSLTASLQYNLPACTPAYCYCYCSCLCLLPLSVGPSSPNLRLLRHKCIDGICIGLRHLACNCA